AGAVWSEKAEDLAWFDSKVERAQGTLWLLAPESYRIGLFQSQDFYSGHNAMQVNGVLEWIICKSKAGGAGLRSRRNYESKKGRDSRPGPQIPLPRGLNFLLRDRIRHAGGNHASWRRGRCRSQDPQHAVANCAEVSDPSDIERVWC